MKQAHQSLRFILAAVCLALAPLAAQAEQSQDFGDYVVHYSALTTEMLPPDVAKAYDIDRSKNRALLNITVLKKVIGNPGTPVEADVEAEATNLTGQLRDIEMRLIREDSAIYHVGTLSVSDEETFDFHVRVTPKGADKPLIVRFRKQFFTD